MTIPDALMRATRWTNIANPRDVVPARGTLIATVSLPWWNRNKSIADDPAFWGYNREPPVRVVSWRGSDDADQS